MEIIFRQPYILLFLLSVPLLIVLHYYFFQHNKKRAMKFANFSAMKRVTGTKLITKNTGQLVLRLISLSFIIFSVAHPIIWYDSEVSVTDYVIAIDSSASMTSRDVLPSRLEVAKQAAGTFVNAIKSNAQFGVISFSGVSFIKMPLISNIEEVKLAIAGIDIELSGGTDIGGALITSANLFDTDKTKAIILITDGSDTAGTFVDESIDAAIDYVKNNQIIVHTIAIGTGSSSAGYIEGVNLPAVYDSSLLKKISEATYGSYYEVKSTSEIASAFIDIEQKSQIAKVPFDMSNIFFVISFILLMFEWTLLNTRFRPLP